MNKRDIENAVYNKANTYYSTVCMLAEHDVLDESTMALVQLAIEGYLSNMIELVKNKTTDEVYGMGRVPHDLMRLYHTLYNGESSALLENPTTDIKNRLVKSFCDFNSKRYVAPDDSAKSTRNVCEKDVLYNVETMHMIKELNERFRDKFFEQKKIKENKEIFDLEK